jgi:hypothetical protein
VLEKHGWKYLMTSKEVRGKMNQGIKDVDPGS